MTILTLLNEGMCRECFYSPVLSRAKLLFFTATVIAIDIDQCQPKQKDQREWIKINIGGDLWKKLGKNILFIEKSNRNEHRMKEKY